MDLKTVPKRGEGKVDLSLRKEHQVRRFSSSVFALAIILGIGLTGALPAQALDASALTQRLDIAVPGQPPQRMALGEAMRTLKIPSISIALIDKGEIAWSGSIGDRGPDTLYQAASISKFVTAIAVLRLVQDGQLDLDTDVRRYRNHPAWAALRDCRERR
jgi:CubicO group peptidase (beta-lactamase class C family)